MKHLRNQATCERKTSTLMEFEVEDSHVMGICTILKLVRCKNREKIHQKKKIIIITLKTVFTWFGNSLTSTELQRFHYFQEKNTGCSSIVFLSKTTISPNLQMQQFLYLCTRFPMSITSTP